MRLDNLILRNFRAFPSSTDTRIDLSHSVVLFYGRNGSGKTSIFDAIELMLTGSIKRFPESDSLSQLVVNARSIGEPAQVTLEASAVSPDRVESRIEYGDSKPSFLPMLGSFDTSLFRHTTYLQQSNLTRLLSADSATLGEVIRVLAIDEDVIRLEQALSDASINRTQRSYQSLKNQAEEASGFLSSLDSQIQTLENTAALESISKLPEDWVQQLTNIGENLDPRLTLPPESPKDAQTVLAYANQLDQQLESRLRSAAEQRNSIQLTIRTAEQFERDELELTKIALQLSRTQETALAAQHELDETNNLLLEIEKTLGGPQPLAAANENVTSLIRVLRQVTSLLTADVCPVCDRPYQDLPAHIEQKIAALSREQSETQQKISALEKEGERLRQIRAKQVAELREAEEKPKRIQEQLFVLRERIGEFLSKYDAMLPKEDLSISSAIQYERRRATQTEAMLRTLTESASALGKIRAELSARVARSTRLSKDSDRLKSQRISLESKLARANLARAKLELFIDNVQEIRRRLSDHIEELLQEFVMVHTKDAFEDLFRRLARNPLFRVTISDVRMRYHKPEVDWRATYGGRIYPGEGVFSQGELNACAVAFFLSLATTHPRSLGILLLDDPVQNMDEIHIEEFGQILKHIKDELGWQILIGLHDESVFTYFKRQLYPSRTGQSAISYVIENDRNGATVNKDQEFRFDPKAFYNSRVA